MGQESARSRQGQSTIAALNGNASPQLLTENGSEEHEHEETTSHAGADRSEAAGGRSTVGRGHRAARGHQAAGGVRGYVSPLAGAVRRDEGRRCEALEGARGGER